MTDLEPVAVANARLREREGLWTIWIRDGRIAKISRSTGVPPGGVDAQGRLLTESFVIAHVHLDKVHTAERVSPEALASYQAGKMDTLRSIRLASEVKKRYRRDEIVSRARKDVEQAIGFGSTHLRAFADTDTKARLEAVRALIDLRDEFRDRIEIQVVAFPQEGIEADPGAEEYVEKAMEEGADVVGGIPWLEESVQAQRSHIAEMFEIAKKHRKPVAMLVDDAGDPNLRTLEMLAKKTAEEGWAGKVQACHARAMSVYPENYARQVASLCADAGVAVVSDPHTGAFHTRIDLFREAGAAVALGQDDCSDGYYPFGRCNMLEVAFLAAHILRRMTRPELDELVDMISRVPASIMGKTDFTLKVGNDANFAVLDGTSVAEALSRHSEPKLAVKSGRVVSGNL